MKEWNDWGNLEHKDLPVIIYGGDKAAYNNDFDTRNKFVKLIDCYDFPPVFKIQSIDGAKEIDRCFPFGYRLATPLESERIINVNFND